MVARRVFRRNPRASAIALSLTSSSHDLHEPIRSHIHTHSILWILASPILSDLIVDLVPRWRSAIARCWPLRILLDQIMQFVFVYWGLRVHQFYGLNGVLRRLDPVWSRPSIMRSTIRADSPRRLIAHTFAYSLCKLIRWLDGWRWTSSFNIKQNMRNGCYDLTHYLIVVECFARHIIRLLSWLDSVHDHTDAIETYKYVYRRDWTGCHADFGI